MGMGSYANFADTVTNKFVSETCPDEMGELLRVLSDNEYTIDQLASCSDGDIQGELEVDLDEDVALLILNTYDGLAMAFEEKTGLTLTIRYHDKEDRGDEVDGFFWEVEGVYVYSPAGEKYKDKIERKFWTNFG